MQTTRSVRTDCLKAKTIADGRRDKAEPLIKGRSRPIGGGSQQQQQQQQQARCVPNGSDVGV